MNFHRESRDESYDAIVVGSGVGGLSAAALLARAGRCVLLVERHDRPGGYAHSFRRQSQYTFDAAVHMISSCEPADGPAGGLMHRLLSTLEIDADCRFAKVDPLYSVEFPGLSLKAPSGVEAFVEAHAERFPGERAALAGLVALTLRLRDEFVEAQEIFAAGEHPDPAGRLGTLLEFRSSSLGEVLDAFISDARLRSCLATLWPYLGLPPSKLSFLYWALMCAGYVADGGYYCAGSFQNLANALAGAVESHGGEVLYRAVVRRIIVEGGRVTGVVLENGQRISAPVVVANSDARHTVEDLVGREHFPAPFLRRFKRLRRSLSAFVVYLATDLDVRRYDVEHEMFLFSTFDHDANHEGSARGSVPWLTATIPTLSDPDLAPPGEHLMVLTTLVASDVGRSWRETKDEYVETMLAVAEARFPGLRRHLRFVEGASPRTMERYTLNTGGALYGWELSPQQVVSSRLRNNTPIAGLVLAGHWTVPGAGVCGVALSGAFAAQHVLGCRSMARLWEALA